MQGRLDWHGYAVAWARLHGGFDPRLATPVVAGWLRMSYQIGSVLARLRVPPMAVTVVGVLFCAATPLAVLRRPDGVLAGAALVVLAAVADSADGAVAVITGRTTRLGYVYDSLADRVGEAFWLLAFWLCGAPGALVAAAGAFSWLHEYLRARSVAAGMREIGTVTTGERPSRVAAAFVGLLLAGMTGLIRADLVAGVVTVVAAVWALLGLFGLSQLIAAVRRSLSER